MNVLITIPRLDLPGGVANYFKTIKPYLNNHKYYFEIGAKPNENTFAKQFWRFISDFWRFNKKLKNGKYELVHINPSLGFKSVIRDGILILISTWYRVPTLVFFHGWDHECEKTIRKYFLQIFHYIFNKANAFVVLANDFKEQLIGMGLTVPIYIETTLVDDNVFIYNKYTDDMIVSQDANFNILYLSRIELEKGVKEAIDAFVLVKQKYPDINLVIAGDGSEYMNMQNYVIDNNINGVTFLGNVDGDIKHNVFMNSDIYLLPTYSEGMPTTVLEAMAYGLPVITRPVGGLKDFFEEKKMGYLTNSLDPVELSRLLELMINNTSDRKAMGAYNRDYAQKRFTASQVASRLEVIYEHTRDKRTTS